MERRLAAILVADVVGYSRLMEADETSTLGRLKALREGLIHPTIANHHGRVVKLVGDGMLAEFASVVDAVVSAVAVQKEIAARNRTAVGPGRIELRIGVHLGDVIVEGDDLYGDGVNVAARLEALAEAGGVCISQQAMDQVETKLDFIYDDLGEQRVKNIARPVRVYRLHPGGAARSRRRLAVVPTARRRAGWAVAAAAVLLLAMTGVVWWSPWSAPVDPAAPRAPLALPDEPSIAVLPLHNLTGDGGLDYIADGITEDIISALSQLPSVFVIGRGSSFAYKDKAVGAREVAAELGVRFILEGSIRRADDMLRITTQLTDAVAGRQIWSEQYDRPVAVAFEVQDEITARLVEELEVKVAEGDQARLRRRSTDVPEAYQMFRLAESSLRRGGKDDMMRAREYAERALELDPDFAAGWGVLAWIVMQDERYYGDRAGDWLAEPEAMARRALELDREHSPALILLAFTHMDRGRFDEAVAYGEQAVEHWPGSSDITALFGVVLFADGQYERGLAQLRRAMRLSPHFPTWYLASAGRCLVRMGEYEAAVAEFERALARDPVDIFLAWALAGKAEALAGLGRHEEARQVVAQLRRQVPWFTLTQLRDNAQIKDQDEVVEILAVMRELGLPEA